MQDAEFSTTSTTKVSCTDVNSTEANIIVSELSDEALLKMEVIQSLLENSDRTTYTQCLQEAAKKLGKSVRTVRRLVDKWEQEGLPGLAQNQRADKGKHRVDENWQEFVLKTYKEGNKGSKRMTRQQVFIRAKAKADELGVNPDFSQVRKNACISQI
ncbi:integrase catalytic subunit [Calothrix sp. NIES-4101]|nr:integrase catalytic subunit [Calothrix sp. NIES-4101]